MIFFPYRVDLSLHRLPYATIAVSVLCLLVFYHQFHNSQAVQRDTYWFCQRDAPRLFRMVMNNTYGHYTERDCVDLMWGIRMSDDPEDYINKVVGKGQPLKGFEAASARVYAAQLVHDEYTEFERRVPPYDTKELWYKPDSWDPVSMVTAAFAHGSWMHVIGNLIFFFAFAASVEIIVGWWQFLLLILALALGTHTFYSLSMLAVNNPPPTVGLVGSGNGNDGIVRLLPAAGTDPLFPLGHRILPAIHPAGLAAGGLVRRLGHLYAVFRQGPSRHQRGGSRQRRGPGDPDRLRLLSGASPGSAGAGCGLNG